MLGYEWGSQSPPPPQLILTHNINHHDPSPSSSSSHHHRPIFDDPFSTPCTFPHDNPYLPHPQFPLYDHSMLSTLDHENTTLPGPTGFQVLVPKSEPENPNRIGLNLGGRTYFAAADDDLVSRLYWRSRVAQAVVNSPKCQAEGCHADLSHAKHYHRRHKVCEFHSKAATVVAAGLIQRFCQQCSRFHMLSEFDNGKRSCRKRLADHNRRRRKSNQSQTVNLDHRSTYPLSETARSSLSQQRSPSDSGANSASSVTVAVSFPLASFDSGFRQRSFQ